MLINQNTDTEGHSLKDDMLKPPPVVAGVIERMAHFKMKIKGKTENIQMFWQLMRSLDSDFPYGNGKIPKGMLRTYKQCPQCHGLIWNRPMMTQEEIRRAAQQCSVTVKIKLYIDAKDCQSIN